MKPEEAIRPPYERTVAQFNNSTQKGGVYQDLTINPDYVNTEDNQPYAALSETGRGAAEYEQCDVPVKGSKKVEINSVKKIPQYENLSVSAQEGNPENIKVYAEKYENNDYENKNSSSHYYNL